MPELKFEYDKDDIAELIRMDILEKYNLRINEYEIHPAAVDEGVWYALVDPKQIAYKAVDDNEDGAIADD